METLKIKTERLQVRNMKMTDLHDFHVYRSNPEVTKYQGFDVMTMGECEKFIERQLDKPFGKPGEWVQYAIESSADGKLIGDCAVRLHEHDPRIAEIGITISHLHQKQGFAKEAMHAIVAFLFGRHPIHRIVETVDAENIASISLLKATGFRQEGHFIENIFFKGKWGSEYQFAMLRREWEAKRKFVAQNSES